MSIYLRVEFFSSMDRKFEVECGYDGELTYELWDELWVEFIKGLQFVKDCRLDNNGTIIEFSNEASKTWFLMRWS